MKQKLLSLVLLFLLVSIVSCDDSGYIATINYTVYYPGEPIKYEFSFECGSDPGYALFSHRGSNVLKVHIVRDSWFARGWTLEDTTAPIRVETFTVKKK